MTRLTPLTRALIRLRGGHSDHPRDVERDLRRALKRAVGRDGEPQAVQVAGQPLETADYAHWRERALRRGTVSSAPELEPGRYALVLLAYDPGATQQFVRHGAAVHLTPTDRRRVQAHDRAGDSARRDARLLARPLWTAATSLRATACTRSLTACERQPAIACATAATMPAPVPERGWRDCRSPFIRELSERLPTL